MVTIFYSWQSDLPKAINQNGIRLSLRDALNLVESALEDTQIVLDEATRNTTGSPNIPTSIFNKILASDIFVCDLTTINGSATEEFRKVPNPNVLIELGYAIGLLGWDRIILLFNTNFGSFPSDLPFDIDRQRVISFSIKNKDDKNGRNELSRVLKNAIQLIIEKSPNKPTEKRAETLEERKRIIDINNIKWALGSIHIVTFDNFIENIPDRIIGRILLFHDWFNDIVESNLFHIYDERLNIILKTFKKNWNKTLSYSQHYNPVSSGRNYAFYMPGGLIRDEESGKAYDDLSKLRVKLQKNFKDLLSYIRANYLEVDLEETSKAAFEGYKKVMVEE